MEGNDVAVAAKQYVNAYKYIYGAKGELCSSAHIEELIAQSPAYFSDESKATAARQKVGSYCADCSGYVCICSGYTQYGSYALYNIAKEKYPLVSQNGKVIANGTFIPRGAILWKKGHVGIYIGSQKVVEARSELLDVQINIIGDRDFTHCLLLEGIDYEVDPNDAGVDSQTTEGNGYIAWTGKVINTPVIIPQISASNSQAAVGFGMLENGTFVTVVGVSGSYYRIMSQSGYYGYVYSYYIGTASAPSYENQYCQWTGSANSTTGIVNIRIGPSTTYDQLSAVPSVSNGATFEVLGEVLGNADNKLWYYIRVLGQYYGYVRADLVSKQVMTSYTAWVGKASSSTGTVNIRTAPTVNSSLSSVQPSLKNGDVVTVTNETRSSDGMIWYTVSVDGKYAGYCRSDLIEPNVEDYYVEWDGQIKTTSGSANIRRTASTSADKIVGSPYSNGTNVRVLGEVNGSDGYVWYHLSVKNTYTGYCRCDLIITTDDYPNWWAKANTTTGTLNIRSGAGTGYALISGCPSVENGTQLKVIDQLCGTDGGVWYKVIVNSKYTGYVKGNLVISVNTVAYSSWIGCARSTTGVVNVRSSASTSSAVISGYSQLKNGDCFSVIGQKEGTDGYLWFYVRIMGLYYGYIRSDLVSHGTISESNSGYASWTGVTKSTTGTVNMRSGAGTSTSIVVSLANGVGVEVIGTKNGTDGYVWYQVKYGTINGYIRSDLIVHQSTVSNGSGSSGGESTGETYVYLKCAAYGLVVANGYANSAPYDNAEPVIQISRISRVKLINKVIPSSTNEAWYVCDILESIGNYIRGYIKGNNIIEQSEIDEIIQLCKGFDNKPMLVCQYMRKEEYNSSFWNVVAGKISENEIEKGELYIPLSDLENFSIYDQYEDYKITASHLFATLNALLYKSKINTLLSDVDQNFSAFQAFVDLYNLMQSSEEEGEYIEKLFDNYAGWAGDLVTGCAEVQSRIDQQTNVTKENYEEEAAKIICAPGGDYFSYDDMLADIDAVNLAVLIQSGKTIEEAIIEYYVNGKNEKRFSLFLNNIFEGSLDIMYSNAIALCNYVSGTLAIKAAIVFLLKKSATYGVDLYSGNCVEACANAFCNVIAGKI